MKKLNKFGLVSGIIFGLGAFANADYILDGPSAVTIGPAWSFADIDTSTPGVQVDAWYTVTSGSLNFRTDSTQLSNGQPGGTRTFSRFAPASPVVSVDYAVHDSGRLFVKARLLNGSTAIVSPNFQDGSITVTTQAGTPGGSNILALPGTANSTTFSYTDADTNTAGTQVNTWVHTQNGFLSFRTNSTNLSTPQNVNTPVRFDYILDQFIGAGKIYVVANVSGATLAFTPTFNTAYTAKTMMMDVAVSDDL